MKKTTGVLVFIGLLVLMVGTWGMVIVSKGKTIANYNSYIESAHKYEEKEIYIDAVEAYKKALEIEPNNYDIVLALADDYRKLGDTDSFISQCKKAIGMDTSKAAAYEKLADYYVNGQKFKDALTVLRSAKDVNERGKIDNMIHELKYRVTSTYVSAQQIGDWYTQGNSSLATYQYKERWGMIGSYGKKSVAVQYSQIGMYDPETGVYPCLLNNEYYYANSDGNKKYVGDNKYDYLGAISSGLAPAKRDGKYGYIDVQFSEKQFEYEYAGAFAQGVAAVKKDGKWGLIGKDLKMVTGFDYDEILVDSNGFCSLYDTIVVVQNGKYIFIDKSGKKLTDKQFDGAKMAASADGAIAVKTGDKWGFADSKGNMVIDAKYADANSFSLDMAPIKLTDRWGYIDKEGNGVIGMDYEYARPFNAQGAAVVQNGTQWNIIVLCEYGEG